MAQIRKSVGSFVVEAGDPSPVWINITFDDDRQITGVRVEDLRDLQYAISRVLAEIDAAVHAERR